MKSNNELKRMQQIENFDPNGIGVENRNFIGLPFTMESATLILFPVPWDVTVSYRAGTAKGPSNILEASTQLDLYNPLAIDSWKKGIYFDKIDSEIAQKSQSLRVKSKQLIDQLTKAAPLTTALKEQLEEINKACIQLNEWVYNETLAYLNQNKKLGLIGGDHSVPFGYYKALAEKYGDFGIVQIDAHCDLRKAYEGFTYSHASIFYNALNELKSITKLVQVGIRDFCDEEVEYIKQSEGRIETFYNYELQKRKLEGETFSSWVDEVVKTLPNRVYISFDIDGLLPSLCPNTGTPVPGGLSYDEAIYLIYAIRDSGKEIIGFDLCEVAGDNEWDANVGSRITYALCGALLSSELR